jgi:hypothetical protein
VLYSNFGELLVLIPIHAAWIGLERTWAQNDHRSIKSERPKPTTTDPSTAFRYQANSHVRSQGWRHQLHPLTACPMGWAEHARRCGCEAAAPNQTSSNSSLVLPDTSIRWASRQQYLSDQLCGVPSQAWESGMTCAGVATLIFSLSALQVGYRAPEAAETQLKDSSRSPAAADVTLCLGPLYSTHCTVNSCTARRKVATSIFSNFLIAFGE